MSVPYRSTPLESREELYEIYGTSTASEIPFLQKLDTATANLREIINNKKLAQGGLVVSIEGTWGSGKTSFVELLCKGVEDMNVAVVKYDSLYYGNVSEATDIFIKDIFEEVRERFGIKLANGSSIAKNITPKFELSNGLPKFALDYTASRAPTEVIKKKLEDKLRQLPGKMMVVIDDIDRVSADDVVHFLRVIRVLRELPNFVIIMPIDRAMLEKLLRTQGIENPRSYLQKIIDYPVDLNPEQGNSKDLFFRLLKTRYPDENITDGFYNLTWELYLWEISLAVIRQYEVNDQRRFILSTGPTDPLWQLLEPADSLLGENLVRKFFEQTSTTYGAQSNYVFRVMNSDSIEEDIYQHYPQIFTNMTFTDLMYSKFLFNLSPQSLHAEVTRDHNMMSMRWWDDKESIIQLQSNNDRTQKGDYRIAVPSDDTERNAYYSDLNSKAHHVWDTIGSLAGAYLPEKAIQFLTPRTLNRVMDQLEIDFSLFASASRAEDYVELQRKVRKAVQQVIVFNP